jgi:hypothetical protein
VHFNKSKHLNFSNIYLCLKPSMIYYTSSFSEMTFFNIILNIIVHIHQKIKSHITHLIFMKMHLCPCLHDKKTFCFGRSFSNYVVFVVEEELCFKIHWAAQNQFKKKTINKNKEIQELDWQLDPKIIIQWR